MKIASRLAFKTARGKELTRRERKQLTRTTADMFRLVPLIVVVVRGASSQPSGGRGQPLGKQGPASGCQERQGPGASLKCGWWARGWGGRGRGLVEARRKMSRHGSGSS